MGTLGERQLQSDSSRFIDTAFKEKDNHRSTTYTINHSTMNNAKTTFVCTKDFFCCSLTEMQTMWSLLVESLPQSRLSLKRWCLANVAVAPLCAQTTGNCGGIPVCSVVELYWFIAVPAPKFRFRIQPSVFQQNLPFQCKKQRCFPENWPLIFYFLTLVFHSMLDPVPNPVPEPETECTTVLVPAPLRQKVAVPVPQHCPVRYLCYVRFFVLIFNAFGGSLISF